MAIANPRDVDLTGAYRNIIEAIKSKGEAEASMPPSGLAQFLGQAGKGFGQGVVKQIDRNMDAKQQKDLLQFKSHLEKDMSKYTADLEKDKEGVIELDDEQVKKYFADKGITDERFIPKLAKGKLKTTQAKLEELMNLSSSRVELENIAEQYDKTEPKKAAAIRALAAADPKKAAELQLQEEAGKFDKQGKPLVIKDPTSSSGYRHALIVGDKIVPQPFEATEDQFRSFHSGPASLDPRKREQDLRKEFTQKVKDIGFINRVSSYREAVNAEKNVSIANDAGLIYAVARMRDPGGRLSEQDVAKAGQSGTLDDDVQQAFNKVLNKKQLLTDFQRKNLMDSVKQLYVGFEKDLGEIENQFKELADAEGISPKNVIVNFRPKLDDVKSSIKIMTDPKTKKRYEVEIGSDGKRKVIREVK